MKKMIYFIAITFFVCSANAQIIREAEPVDYHNIRTPSQIEVGAYRPREKEIDYIVEHSTNGELRDYAKMLNMKEREEAKLAGITLPEKLSDEILNDKEKLIEYIRSCYKFPY